MATDVDDLLLRLEKLVSWLPAPDCDAEFAREILAFEPGSARINVSTALFLTTNLESCVVDPDFEGWELDGGFV